MTPTIWDQLLAAPIAMIAALTFAAMVQVLAGPRIFRRPARRLGAALALAVYLALTIAAGPEAVSGRWQADAALVARSLMQAIPSIVLLMALRKLEQAHCDRPLKTRPWAAA